MDENAKKMAKVMAKCWADEKFKKELIADPARVLKEQGIDVPAGLKVSFHENTEKEAHIIIPQKPSVELSNEELDKIAGGVMWGSLVFEFNRGIWDPLSGSYEITPD